MWEVFNYRTGETITHTNNAFRASRLARRDNDWDYALCEWRSAHDTCTRPRSSVA